MGRIPNEFEAPLLIFMAVCVLLTIVVRLVGELRKRKAGESWSDIEKRIIEED